MKPTLNPLPGPRQKLVAGLAAAVFSLLALPALAASSAPERFGDDHDDPRTAYPAVRRPANEPCVVELIDHGFASFDPARATLDAARQCPGPWHKVVMEMDGAVKGRQYDRIGHLSVGGVTIFRTSSPEPSREGIRWHVEKDVTAYAPLFSRPQPVEMHLGNLVNETYTGVFQVKVRMLFHPADATHPVASTPDIVVPLDRLRHDGPDTLGNITLPANAERLVAEVYATGSGGGCEEFWYYAIPDDSNVDKYWCRGPQGPYREVQVLVDGRLAGIAAPFPHIYTGGWSNPFLWYTIPAPRAFDIHPIRFDLTPFVGLLNDGQPHEVRLHVVGIAAVATGGVGWALHPSIHVWRDAGSTSTRGELIEASHNEPLLRQEVASRDGGRHELQATGHHAFRARGRLRTSKGTVETTVETVLTSAIRHDWDDGDARDGMTAEWTDTTAVSRRTGWRKPASETIERGFGLTGAIETEYKDGKPRQLTTTLDIHDEARTIRGQGRSAVETRRDSDRFQGTASYTSGVPREKRVATATSRQLFTRTSSDGTCFRRELATRNGRFVKDEEGCETKAGTR